MIMTHATVVTPRDVETGFPSRLVARIDRALAGARTREMLLRLDDRMLRDIGLTRGDAMFRKF